MTPREQNLSEFLKKLAASVTGLITFVSAVVGFVRLWQGDTSLVTFVSLSTATIGGWIGCAYYAFARTPPLVQDGSGTWRYPRLRPFGLVGLVVITLIVLCGIGYYFYPQFQSTSKIIVLVADFDGPDPQKYRVTETVLARLKQALAPYDDVQIQALGRSITEAEGSTTARDLGKNRHATILIWGWYGKTTETVPLSVV